MLCRLYSVLHFFFLVNISKQCKYFSPLYSVESHPSKQESKKLSTSSLPQNTDSKDLPVKTVISSSLFASSACFCMHSSQRLERERKMVSVQRILVCNYLLISLAVVLGLLANGSWAEDKLVNLTRLKMFVDELPDMPKIKAFHLVNGVPKPKSLKIGMYKINWVIKTYIINSPLLPVLTIYYSTLIPY